MYLVDTNVFSFAFWEQRGLSWEGLEKHGFERIALSRAVWCELKVLTHFGQNCAGATGFLANLENETALVEVTPEDWSLVARVRGTLKRKGKDLGPASGSMGVILACQAFRLAFTVVTDNMRNFETIKVHCLGELLLENWCQ